MEHRINKIKKSFIFVLLYFFSNISYSTAETFNEIQVKGNKRLSVETVLMFSDLKTGIDYDDRDLNNAIKKLYKTDYFKNVEFEVIDSILEIKIEENPIIQSNNLIISVN